VNVILVKHSLILTLILYFVLYSQRVISVVTYVIDIPHPNKPSDGKIEVKINYNSPSFPHLDVAPNLPPSVLYIIEQAIRESKAISTRSLCILPRIYVLLYYFLLIIASPLLFKSI
jgi:exosome complex RNA-binding protein Rrp42 (RNase PH superfamily)